VLAGAKAPSIGGEASAQWRSFTHLSASTARGPDGPSESRSRLLSGAGNRYDYWRIAWGLWREHPLAGTGQGSFTTYYYQRRATTEDIDQPHSIELEVLSELGLVGGGLLACVLAAGIWGAWRTRRAAHSSQLARGVAVAAVGSLVAWGAQTSVDWMHLLPGLGAVALIALASLTAPRAQTDRAGQRARISRARTLGAYAALATLVVAGASLSRQVLAQVYADRARSELRASPASAVTDANRSLTIDSDAIQTYYVKAAALARFGQAPAAEAALEQALAREPDNFVTWALLGDIAVREGRTGVAGWDYRHAHALNPRNATLAALAAHPTLGRSTS
jgi:hypothetical protein